MTDTRCSPGSTGLPFQNRVVNWLMECFSMDICRDGVERNHRFLEEALELVQSLNCTRSEAHQLVDYVFDRPAGEPLQELGGSLLTLTALANCHDMDMMEAGETELARVWTKIDKIRAKQAAKPKHGPLPQHVDVAQRPPKDVRELAANAIRTFCQSLGSGVVVHSVDGQERIYYSGISLDALSVAVALALSASPPSPVAGEWQKIETIPQAKAGEQKRFLLWSSQLGPIFGDKAVSHLENQAQLDRLQN